MLLGSCGIHSSLARRRSSAGGEKVFDLTPGRRCLEIVDYENPGEAPSEELQAGPSCGAHQLQVAVPVWPTGDRWGSKTLAPASG